MVWTAPEIVRVDEPFTGDERAMLNGFLDYGRATLLMKCAGLTADQLVHRPLAPSRLSLLGLVRHVTDVERTWFRYRFAGQDLPSLYGESAFEADPAQARRDLDRLTTESTAARTAVTTLPLNHTFTSPRWGPMSLRWCYLHLIGEYDRHNGHADLIREHLDGTTGT